MTSRNQNRAQWYRIDLHLHTPASADYQQPEISYLDILHRAEMRGIDIIAFTDHNTVSGYAALRREVEQLEFLAARGRATLEEQQLLTEYQRVLSKVLVLPGFEFTATFGFHILGLFPPDTPVRRLEHLLLGLRVPYEAIERGLTEVGASADVLTAYRAIRNEGGMVIAAHVNAAHGVAMWNLDFGGQTRIAYTQDPYLSALEVTDLAKRGRYATSHFFDGSKPEYPRRMHCIQGSDAHRLDSQMDRLGKVISFGVGERATEVRLMERSFEALRELFESNDFGNTRAYSPGMKPPDAVIKARAEGPSLIQSFHENATQGGVLRMNILSDICAFANANGGTIYLGIGEDKQKLPVGIDMPQSVTDQILRAAGMMISPQLELLIDTLTSHNKSIIRIQVPAGPERPYAMDGSKIYLRADRETRLASRDEIIQLVINSQTRQRSARPTPPPAAPVEAEEQVQEAAPAQEAPPAPERRPRRDEGRRRPEMRPVEPIETASADENTAPEMSPQPPDERHEPRPVRLPERRERDQRPPRTEHAPAQPAAPVSDLPRVGVELVSFEARGSLNVYTLRDLQTQAVVSNITRVTKVKLWQYAIKQNEKNPVRAERVRWNDVCGLWRKYRRQTEVRYDLVLGPPENMRIFYGVPESELKGGWLVFRDYEAQAEEAAASAAPEIETEAVFVPVEPEIAEAPEMDTEAATAADETVEVNETSSEVEAEPTATTDAPAKRRRRRRGGRRRRGATAAAPTAEAPPIEAAPTPEPLPVVVEEPVVEAPKPSRKPARKRSSAPKTATAPVETPTPQPEVPAVAAEAAQPEPAPTPAAKPRRSRKTKTVEAPPPPPVEAAPAKPKRPSRKKSSS